MYSTFSSALFITATTLFVLASPSAAQVPGQWPTPDQVPAIQSQWSTLTDASTIPNAPIQKTVAGNCAQAQTYCYWSCNTCQRPDDVIVCPGQKDWGLTYDDGPSIYTPALLDYLKKNNVKATFFIVGSRVLEHPEILKRTITEGHQIGIHTWSHPYLTTLTNDQIVAELKWTEAIIKAVVGVTPIYMRPPYGDADDRVRSIVTQLGYKLVIWDVDTNDWKSDSNPKFDPNIITNIAKNAVAQKSSTGHISLEHDLFPVAAAAGPKVLDIILGAGFAAKPVGTCLGAAFYKENGTVTTAIITPTSSIASTTSTATTSSVTPTVTPTAAANVTSTDNSPSTTDSSQTSNGSLPTHSLSSFALFIESTLFCVMFFMV